MPRRMLCSALAGLFGTVLLLSGCDKGVDKSGPAVPPDQMDQQKQKQYSDFMKKQGGGGGGDQKSAPPPPHG